MTLDDELSLGSLALMDSLVFLDCQEVMDTLDPKALLGFPSRENREKQVCLAWMASVGVLVLMACKDSQETLAQKEVMDLVPLEPQVNPDHQVCLVVLEWLVPLVVLVTLVLKGTSCPSKAPLVIQVFLVSLVILVTLDCLVLMDILV